MDNLPPDYYPRYACARTTRVEIQSLDDPVWRSVPATSIVLTMSADDRDAPMELKVEVLDIPDHPTLSVPRITHQGPFYVLRIVFENGQILGAFHFTEAKMLPRLVVADKLNVGGKSTGSTPDRWLWTLIGPNVPETRSVSVPQGAGHLVEDETTGQGPAEHHE